ncbi:SusC/RagA family TonB-linked outer membrane protein [Dyadobacter luteus]|uniref:SusC/RagA family TonB-linked outer membrane protein n=1 Tax=Dyadobacter luteus TaxID=2259619 RepID=A0A3D8Y770_9BACT|nr:TonB-dependent receptor [Dyadobacter luteus]REA58842.1 SusC/RagA family TonB-linked outer membrane protein [Dyadobacter luteus]
MRKTFIITVFCLLITCLYGYGQSFSVSGKIVTSEDETSLAGVTIQEKGTTNGSQSDAEGRYSLQVSSPNATLIFSFVGMVSKEELVGNRSVIDVKLTSDSRSLGEVVVTGFGSQIKRDLTGNIASIKGADIQNTPVPNFNQALQGRAAGVFVESNSGKVGEGIKVRIRGTGSISASNDPLYVIDGIPVNSSALAGSATSGNSPAPSGNPLADINFNDIESFEILKDASAAAIYGSRAANGVVLITTKKGKSGKTSLTANVQYGFNKPTHLRGFLNAKQYVELLREAAINSDALEGINSTDPAQYEDSWLESAEGRLDRYSGGTDWRTQQTNTNWEKLAFNDASRTKIFDINASGGNEKTRFYISAGYNDQDGILIGNDFKRLSGRINLDHDINSRLKIGFNMGLSRTIANRLAQDNQFASPMQIIALAPITPVRNAAGEINDRPVTTYYNPLMELGNKKFQTTGYRNIGSTYLAYNIVKGLTFRTEFGFDILNQDEDIFSGVKTEVGQSVNGQGSSYFYRTVNYNTNNYFNYNILKDKHSIDLTAGMSFQNYKDDRNSVTGQDFPVDDLKKIESAGKITAGYSTSTESSFLSYFGRANYKFNDRYLLSVSGRVDGSSKFGKDSQYGFFPAVSGGWVISEESFLATNNTISFLKLRGSWGITGNADGFGDFKQLALWGGSKYGGSSGLVPTQLANPDLKWEKSNQIDFGLDFGLFKNRLSGEIDYYVKDTKDLIYNVPVAGTSGFATQTANIGSMQNKGVEFVLNSTNLSGGPVTWTTSLNLSRNINKLTKLDGETQLLPGNDGRFLNSLIVGESIGVFYGPKYAGVDPANGDALYYTENGETTNDYNAAGNFVVGNPNPDWIGGITNTVGYKGVELSFLFQGVFGNQVTNGAGGFMTSSFDWYDNQTLETLDRWQKPGDITNEPQLRLAGGNGTSASSRYVYDASYVRLKNITLSYKLPQAVLQKMKLSSLRLYVTGVNLLTFTKYPGWDPEVNTDYRAGNRNQGSDFYAAPQIKSLTFGLSLGL